MEKEMDNQKEKVTTERESIQFNSQDLDQEQNMNMNPMQLNTQNVHVFVMNEKNDYSSRITGITYNKKTKNIIKDVEILLFFGYESINPVCKERTDLNGNFTIADLPPGFYTIVAKWGDSHSQLQQVKLLPGQTVFHTINL